MAHRLKDFIDPFETPDGHVFKGKRRNLLNPGGYADGEGIHQNCGPNAGGTHLPPRLGSVTVAEDLNMPTEEICNFVDDVGYNRFSNATQGPKTSSASSRQMADIYIENRIRKSLMQWSIVSIYRATVGNVPHGIINPYSANTDHIGGFVLFTRDGIKPSYFGGAVDSNSLTAVRSGETIIGVAQNSDGSRVIVSSETDIWEYITSAYQAFTFSTYSPPIFYAPVHDRFYSVGGQLITRLSDDISSEEETISKTQVDPNNTRTREYMWASGTSSRNCIIGYYDNFSPAYVAWDLPTINAAGAAASQMSILDSEIDMRTAGAYCEVAIDPNTNLAASVAYHPTDGIRFHRSPSAGVWIQYQTIAGLFAYESKPHIKWINGWFWIYGEVDNFRYGEDYAIYRTKNFVEFERYLIDLPGLPEVFCVGEKYCTAAVRDGISDNFYIYRSAMIGDTG